MQLERDTFQSLVERHHAAVFATARRLLRSDADARDVTQQVFVGVWQQRTPLDADPEAAGRQLRWRASRLSLSWLRAARRRRRHEQETAAMHRDRSVVDTNMAGEEAAVVQRELAGLDDDDRVPIVLRFFEGMTLQAIGSVLGCAESTVHARLQQALATLRRRLGDRGLAVAAGLEQLLATAALVPPAVPAGLLPRLLSIPTATASFVAGKIAAAALAVFAIGAVALAAGHDADVPSLPTLAASAVAAGAPNHTVAFVSEATPQEPQRQPWTMPSAVAPQVDRASALASAPRAEVAGTVTDPAGAPLALVRVVAWCRTLSRKAEPFEIAAVTTAQGAYTLSLPVTDPAGLAWQLSLHREDWAGEFAPALLLLRGGEVRTGVDATMRHFAADAAGEWATTATVTDGAGRPVGKAAVVVLRRTLDRQGRPCLLPEAQAATDAAGSVALRGDHHGEKVVRCSAFGQPFAPWEQALAIHGAAPAAIVVAFASDVPLRVRAVAARTGAPVRGMLLTAERNGRSLACGVTSDDGEVVLRGVDALPCELVGGGDGWSRFTKGDVVAGLGVVELRLKRADDPEPVGLCAAELHGRVVDAATGEPLPVASGAVTTWWLPADSAATAHSLLQNAVTPAPFQTAAMHEPPPPRADFHLPAPDAPRCALLLRVEGRAVAVAGPFDLEPGRLITGIELRAEVGVRVEVAVRDAQGQPVADAEVWLDGDDQGAVAERAQRAADLLQAARLRDRARTGRGVRSDGQGRAVFAHVPTGVPLCVHVADRSGRQGQGGATAFTGSSAACTVTVR